MTVGSPSPVRPGQPAPDFRLPAVNRDGEVSLGDYRGRQPLFLALFRGVWCPFCRRQIVQMGAVSQKLSTAGIDSLAIVATPVDNARRYFRYRPARVTLAADAELKTHDAYGLPRRQVTPEFMSELQTTRTTANGELPEAMPLMEVGAVLDRRDGFERSEVDNAEIQQQFPLVIGQFLIDRDGVVRWANLEGQREGLHEIGTFPTAEEVISAVTFHAAEERP